MQVYPTSSKVVGFAPQGTEVVRRWRALLPAGMPFVAIGGITHERASRVLEAGADGIAVIGAITKAEDIDCALDEWLALWKASSD